MIIYEKAKPLIGNMLNYEVVGGTTPPTAFNKENTIWINTGIEMGNHQFSYKDPYYIITDNLYNPNNLQDGTLLDPNGLEDYTIAYFSITDYIEIPDNLQKMTLTEYYTTTGAGHVWYNEDKEIISAFLKASGIHELTPPENAKYIRLTQNKNRETHLILTMEYYSTQTNLGEVWIQTDYEKASVGFNAIKRNELMIYPYKLKQWDGSAWKVLGGSLYQNNNVVQNYNSAVQFYPGATVNSTYSTSDIHDQAGFHIWQKSADKNDNTGILYIAVDLTNINTLTVTGHFGLINAGGYVGVWLHNSIATNPPYYTTGQGSDSSQYTLMQRITSASNTQTNPTTYDVVETSFSFDVSDLTDIYYLHLGGYSNRTSSSYPVVINGDIESVIGE